LSICPTEAGDMPRETGKYVPRRAVSRT